MKIQPKTLKGFRDFLPKEARKRQFVIDTLRKVFEFYGFEPLETPALEYEEILAGKYGEEGEKLMYKFEDKGGRKVALRYDQTVPLARVVAQYSNSLPLPFKRYQISNVWRGENPQAGRFREFLQCDIDTVGTESVSADIEILDCVNSSLRKLGFNNFTILVNDRRIFAKKNISPEIIRILDKEEKIGVDKMLEEMTEFIGSSEKAKESYEMIKNLTRDDFPESFQQILKQGKKLNLFLLPSSRLARGLDYYTGLIFEIRIPTYKGGSVCGGGRYDDLIGMFGYKQIPAVGCSFGFDRVIEAMDTLNLFPAELITAKVLVTTFSQELAQGSIKAANILRNTGINTEVYPDPDVEMEKQLKYTDQKGIPYVVIIGPKEAEENSATVKNMKTGEQKTVSLEQLPDFLK